MKRLIILICIACSFSCTEDTAGILQGIPEAIYENNISNTTPFDFSPPNWILGTWMSSIENETIKGF